MGTMVTIIHLHVQYSCTFLSLCFISILRCILVHVHAQRFAPLTLWMQCWHISLDSTVPTSPHLRCSTDAQCPAYEQTACNSRSAWIVMLWLHTNSYAAQTKVNASTYTYIFRSWFVVKGTATCTVKCIKNTHDSCFTNSNVYAVYCQLPCTYLCVHGNWQYTALVGKL